METQPQKNMKMIGNALPEAPAGPSPPAVTP
jgi:hypothetical protein